MSRISQFFQNPDGSLSSRRIVGSLQVALGITGEIFLFCYGVKNSIPDFTKLESMCWSLITTGSALIAATGIDYFSKQKKEKNASAPNTI